MAKPQTIRVRMSSGQVVLFRWSKRAGLYLCPVCKGGVPTPDDCWPHAERAHLAGRP